MYNCFIIFKYRNTEKKIDQVISVVISKLPKKYIEKFRLSGVKPGLMKEFAVT